MNSLILISFIVLYTVALSILGGFALLTGNGEEKYHALAVHWARVILRTAKITVTVRGKEKLETGKAYLYVANHASNIDVWILLAALPGQVRFVFKKELAAIPIFGWVLRNSGHVVLDRSSRDHVESLENAAAVIKQGRSIVFFPEGTRSVDGRLGSFKRGSFQLAFKAMVPVVPVTINGSFGIWRRGSMAINSGDVEVVVGDPIDTTSRHVGRDAEVELMGLARTAIGASYTDQ